VLVGKDKFSAMEKEAKELATLLAGLHSHCSITIARDVMLGHPNGKKENVPWLIELGGMNVEGRVYTGPTLLLVLERSRVSGVVGKS